MADALEAGDAASWRLTPDVARRTQGFVVSGFGHLPAAEALLLRQVAPGSAWLRAVQRIAPVSDATGRSDQAAVVAFTASGLSAIGLSAEALATFDLPFREGMDAAMRRRALGDAAPDAIVEGGTRWGNTGSASVHALLLLYGRDTDAVREWANAVLEAAAPQAGCIRRVVLDLQRDERGFGREHFGFTDGLSQPVPYGAAIVTRTGARLPPDPWHGVASGDILLGHIDAHGDPAPSPFVTDTPDARAAGLERGTAPFGFVDLGINGSYLVVRELQQDVEAFWGAMERCAQAIRRRDPAATIDARWVAAKVVGRDSDGHMLCPSGTLPAGPDGSPQNAMGFFDRDRWGLGCPLGSHVRRANPRDGLVDTSLFQQTALTATNRHRLLRRGRRFGPTALDQTDTVERGLLFMCLNTDLARQFEFVQQSWLLNEDFATLHGQTDPVVGAPGPHTLPNTPLRRVISVDRFVRLAGGAYFYLPSLPALRFLCGPEGQSV